MTDHFKRLTKELPAIKKFSNSGGVNGFFGQEVLRFQSIAGTLLTSFNCGKRASIDERYITHILARSLMENYFWLIYIYDDSAKKVDRYNDMVNSFKRDYGKLMNEPKLSHKDQLESADSSWSSLSRAMDVNSMLTQITIDTDTRLNYLYFVYRITSFDTHGKNLENIAQEVFGKTVNFPILDITYAFDLIANQYLVTLQQLRDASEI